MLWVPMNQTSAGNDKPSRTAYKIALSIIILGAKPGMDRVLPPGIAEATAKLLVASGLISEYEARWYRSRAMVSFCEAFDWMMPGQFEALGHRKAFFERQVRDGIGQGATQVLTLGAGYDTLGWCLAPEFSDRDFFEIDKSATAHLKAKGFTAMGMHDNLHLIPADLRELKLTDVVSAHRKWDKAAPTVIIAEGLLMYLPFAVIQDLLVTCAAMTGAGSRFAFTYVAPNTNGHPDAGPWTNFVLWTLQLYGEPWLWSIHPEQLGHFLEQNGWQNAPYLLGSTNKQGVEFFAVGVN